MIKVNKTGSKQEFVKILPLLFEETFKFFFFFKTTNHLPVLGHKYLHQAKPHFLLLEIGLQTTAYQLLKDYINTKRLITLKKYCFTCKSLYSNV